MPPIRLLLCTLFLALAALAFVPRHGLAQGSAPPSEAEKARLLEQAQKLVNAAARSYQAGDFGSALTSLTKAEVLAELAQDPSLASIRFNIARCLEQLRRDEEALAAYERYDKLPDAPHRKEKAFQAKQSLERRVFGLLSVSCSPLGAAVTIEGLTNGPRPCPWQSARVRPGLYTARVSAPGYRPSEASVTLAAGTAETLQVTLVPEVSTTPSPAIGVSAGPAPADEPGVSPWPYVALGGGAVVAGLGGVLTALAIDERSAAEDLLPGSERDDTVSSFETLRALSYVSYGVGAALVATGAVLFFIPGQKDNPEAARLIPGPSGFTVRF